MVLILWLKLDPNDLKLFTALIVAIFLAVPYLREQRRSSFCKKGAERRQPPCLNLQSISKTFHPGTIHAKKALQNLSLSLNDGDFVTVIGGNGAGKSTHR